MRSPGPSELAFGARFLAGPERFPGRCGARPWGDDAYTFGFCGRHYSFRGLHARHVHTLRSQGDAVADSAEPVVTHVYRADAHDFLEFSGPEYEFDVDHDLRGVRLAGPGFVGRLGTGGPLRGALWIRRRDDWHCSQALLNYFRVLLAYDVLFRGGLLVHSAGVADGAAALLFVGHSGAGKTTMAKLGAAVGNRILNDDINVLNRAGGGISVCGLPTSASFGGADMDPGTRSLEAVLYLQQSRTVELRPLTRAEAAARLLSCSPFVNRDGPRFENVVENIDRITDAVPQFALHFTNDGDAWRSMRTLLREHTGGHSRESISVRRAV